MVTINKQRQKESTALGKQRGYQEVIEFLDQQWSVARDKSLERIKKLDAALGSPSKSLNTILVAGTNGKSLTIHFTARLLKEEGLAVGAYYAPHVLTYNERIAVNQDAINNKAFTDLANEVINTAQTENIKAHSAELLTMIALLYFKQANVDVALLEVSEENAFDPVTLCNPKIVAITRVTNDDKVALEQAVTTMARLGKKDTWVVSADQSKLNLQLMANTVHSCQGKWAMPIRKLASLSYPFEQLHGRCAALAERVAQLFVEECVTSQATVIAHSLLTKPKGQRGRPTLEAKRQSALNPKRTLKQFWKEELSTLPGRFQLLDKEKPTILLDCATNLDAFKNLLLGIRLLHYQQPLKGLAIIIGYSQQQAINTEEFLKLIRYFFKKTSGSIIFYPIKSRFAQTDAPTNATSDVEKITNDIKNLKIKARAAKDFKDALDQAKKTVDERNGLIVITGSTEVIYEYWHQKDIKKL